jgi:hypothetical protein
MRIPFVLLLLVAFATAASAQTIFFDLLGKGGTGLLGSNETGTVTTPGSGGEIGGGIFLDTATNVLTINVGWGSGNGFTDLSGNAANAHIHGPADINTSTGVLVQLGTLAVSGITYDASATSGSITGSFDLDDLSLGTGDLLAGLWYINIHTALNPPGEIRGNLVAIPEPSSLTALLGLTALFALPRRRVRPRP